MNLAEIQPFITSVLKSAPALAGQSILEDDGTYPKTPQREQALSEKGMAIIVWEVESDHLADVAANGTASHVIYVPVVVEENVKVNRSDTGTKMVAMKALQAVLAAISGKRPTPTSNEVFLPDDPPFQNLGNVNGVNRIVAYFTLKTTIQPA